MVYLEGPQEQPYDYNPSVPLNLLPFKIQWDHKSKGEEDGCTLLSPSLFLSDGFLAVCRFSRCVEQLPRWTAIYLAHTSRSSPAHILCIFNTTQSCAFSGVKTLNQLLLISPTSLQITLNQLQSQCKLNHRDLELQWGGERHSVRVRGQTGDCTKVIC